MPAPGYARLAGAHKFSCTVRPRPDGLASVKQQEYPRLVQCSVPRTSGASRSEECALRLPAYKRGGVGKFFSLKFQISSRRQNLTHLSVCDNVTALKGVLLFDN